jgi:hypothetical protein
VAIIVSRPHTPAPLEADCHEIHETASTLLTTLGQPIFEPLTGTLDRTNGKPQAPELFYCKGPQANGVGEYTSEGFVVHKGSAAIAVMGRSANGWLEWKTDQGQTYPGKRRTYEIQGRRCAIGYGKGRRTSLHTTGPLQRSVPNLCRKH